MADAGAYVAYVAYVVYVTYVTYVTYGAHTPKDLKDPKAAVRTPLKSCRLQIVFKIFA